MGQSTALSNVESSAIAVEYEVLGTKVSLDIDFVKKYLVRGKEEYVTNQELVMFINTCKMQKLNPLANGEVYLIKYSKDSPAQMVVGKDAYTKRAFINPNYIGKEDGITVLRGNQVIQKVGCCLYPTELLIGGWCRVFYERKGKERVAFREVALEEYDQKQSNWKSKPATMINKVAIAQCIRDAFPADYEGLYSEEELVASGVIEVQDTGAGKQIIVDADGVVQQDTVAATVEEDRNITKEERQALFALVQEVYGKEEGNALLKDILEKEGIASTTDLKKSKYDEIVDKINADRKLVGDSDAE